MNSRILVALIAVIIFVVLGMALMQFTFVGTLFEGDGITRKVIHTRLGGEETQVVPREHAESATGVTDMLDTVDTSREETILMEDDVIDENMTEADTAEDESFTRVSRRIVMQTGDLLHSIPLDEILSGGPPKDGIPSIDDPKFVSVSDARAFLDDEEIGLGVTYKGESRFYPYQILVWHEIVNDTIAGDPLLVTYCPLCATGIVFERRVDGVEQEFGVSGRLWQSNLLMYNRTADPDDESLWSQVLGEAVVGPNTGDTLAITSSDTVRFGEWVALHPDTTVLSQDTGAIRNYGIDPYGDYYTNESVSFGATFNDDRAHPKEFVLGVEVNGAFTAYPLEALPVGSITDIVGGVTLTITKNEIDEVNITDENGTTVPTVDGFWFSWLAVHPDTTLWSAN